MQGKINLIRLKSCLEDTIYKKGSLDFCADDILVSADELSQLLQITDRHIRRLVSVGMPKLGHRYYLFGCINFYIDYLQKKNKETTQNKDRLIKAKAEQEEIELKKLQNKVIAVEEVELQTMQLMQILKAALLALPSKLSERLENKTKAEIFSVLDLEIKNELNQIVDKIEERKKENEASSITIGPECITNTDL